MWLPRPHPNLEGSLLILLAPASVAAPSALKFKVYSPLIALVLRERAREEDVTGHMRRSLAVPAVFTYRSEGGGRRKSPLFDESRDVRKAR